MKIFSAEFWITLPALFHPVCIVRPRARYQLDGSQKAKNFKLYIGGRSSRW